MSSELHYLTAVELLEAYRKRELSPVEVAKAVLARIEKMNPVLNAFNLVSDRVIEDASASEARWHAGQPELIEPMVALLPTDVLPIHQSTTCPVLGLCQTRSTWASDE